MVKYKSHNQLTLPLSSSSICVFVCWCIEILFATKIWPDFFALFWQHFCWHDALGWRCWGSFVLSDHGKLPTKMSKVQYLSLPLSICALNSFTSIWFGDTKKKNENQKLSCRWHCRETRYSDWNQLKWSSWHQLTVDPAFVSYDNLFLTSTIIATDFMRFTSPVFLTFILGRVCVCLSFCTFQSF